MINNTKIKLMISYTISKLGPSSHGGSTPPSGRQNNLAFTWVLGGVKIAILYSLSNRQTKMADVRHFVA